MTQQLKDKDDQLQEQSRLHTEEMASLEKQLQRLNQQLEAVGRTRASHSRDPLSTETDGPTPATTAESAKSNAPTATTFSTSGQRKTTLGERANTNATITPRGPQPQITLIWKDEGVAPLEMSRKATVVNGNMTYFMNWSGEVRSCDLEMERAS